MIIDCHLHLVGPGWVRGDYVRAIAKSIAQLLARTTDIRKTPEELIETEFRKLLDPEADRVVVEMDRAGVDKSIVFSVDYGLALGEPRVPIEEQNRLHAKVAEKHPGRFASLVAIDPRRKNAAEHCEEAVLGWGMKGIKLHPAVGFSPSDPICFPLYEKAAQWGVPVLTHTGGQPSAPLTWWTTRPVYVAEAAARYPEVNMVMAHAGMDWWPEAAMAARLLPNVYLDISCQQINYRRNPQGFYRWLRELIDDLGPWKILFATDGPFMNLIVPLEEWARVFKDPKTDIRFTEEEMAIILGQTAQRVFNI